MSVDIAIITIKKEEFEAVLKRLPNRSFETHGRHDYPVGLMQANVGSIRVAVTRCDQGNSAAQDLARNMLEDLKPAFLLVVGIGGAVPSASFTLGDVIVSTRVYDFQLAAIDDGGDRTYSLRGGKVHKDAGWIARNVAAMTDDLGGWNSLNSVGCAAPIVTVRKKDLYGPTEWQADVKQHLTDRFGSGSNSRVPEAWDGAIASTDFLVKDTATLETWLRSGRDISAIDMESAGVYAAIEASEDPRPPFLTIRGLSDIVGYRRQNAWTLYACETAAAFAIALIKSGRLVKASEAPGPGQTDQSSISGGSNPPEKPGAPYSARWYVEPPSAERSALSNIRDGIPVILTGPTRHGKSYLVRRITDPESGSLRSQAASILIVEIDPTDFEGAARFEDCLYTIADKARESADVPEECLRDIWNRDGPTHPQRLDTFMEKHVLTKPSNLVAIVLHGAEHIEQCEHGGKICERLKYWMDKSGSGLWSKFRIIVEASMAAESWTAICGRFNVPVIRTDDFSTDQVLILAKKYGLSWSSGDAGRAAKLVAGHPFLTRAMMFKQATEHLDTSDLFQELVKDAKAGAGFIADYLQIIVGDIHDQEIREAVALLINAPGAKINKAVEKRLRDRGIIGPTSNEFRSELVKGYLEAICR